MFYSLNNNFIAKELLVISILFFNTICGQTDYTKFVDSADAYIDSSSEKALLYLDSIPKPLEDYIEGRISEYYTILALLQNEENKHAQSYQSNILALKYAEKEKNYAIAGRASTDLFSRLYFAKNDSLAFQYLEKARTYYELSGYKNGLIEIDQNIEYAKFLDGKYEECNKLILNHLDNYRKVEEDGYYYLFALYMLVLNHIYIDDLDKAHKYYNELKELKNHKNISIYNFHEFDATIKVDLAESFYKKKRYDSTIHYLNTAAAQRGFMADEVIKEYLLLNSDVHKDIGNLEVSKAYLDTLNTFQKKIFETVLSASNEINTELLKTESQLEEESKRKYFFGISGLALLCILIPVCVLAYFLYKSQKKKQKQLNSQSKNLSHLKTNHEKLTVKVQGLEDYITTLKGKVKYISSINDVDTQKDMIKEFYQNLHLGSSTILDESNNHLELVNDFNINFFNGIKELFPKLNDSEIIICYYIYIGFKNKEIALFLNTSVRGIESKRYRISKKIEFNKEETTLVDFLRETFVEL